MRKALIYPMLIAGAAGFAFWHSAQPVAHAQSSPTTVDPAEGAQLYAQFCAECHGADLEGQPDWRTPGPDGILPAPPHDETGHSWHHTDSMLFNYTKLGGEAALARQGVEFKSGMPGFGDQLTDAQIWNILAFIKSTWPERQREVQAERSAAEAGNN